MFSQYEDVASVSAQVNDLILATAACPQGDVNDGDTGSRATIMLVVCGMVVEDGLKNIMVKQVNNSLDGTADTFVLNGMRCTYITPDPPAQNEAVAPTTKNQMQLDDVLDGQSTISINPNGSVVFHNLFKGVCPMARAGNHGCVDGMLICACHDCLGPFHDLHTNKMPYMPCPVCVGRDIALEARNFREHFMDTSSVNIDALMDNIGRINQRRALMGYNEPARFDDRDWDIDMDLNRDDNSGSDFEADFDDGDDVPMPSNPVSAATIATLRTTLTPAMLGEDGAVRCSICAENPVMGSEVVALPCGHWFESVCIENWFATSNTCPNCRKKVPEVAPEEDKPHAEVGKEEGEVSDVDGEQMEVEEDEAEQTDEGFDVDMDDAEDQHPYDAWDCESVMAGQNHS